MNRDVPEIENCCVKETYAFFGLAAYLAQVLEHSALNLAIALRLPDVSDVTQEVFDGIYNDLSRKTFGNLLNSSKRSIIIPENEIELLNEALDLRNMLIHSFFTIHAENFVSESGRLEMKVYLQNVIEKFNKADKVLYETYAPLWEEYGVTEEYVEGYLADLKKKSEKKDRDA